MNVIRNPRSRRETPETRVKAVPVFTVTVDSPSEMEVE